MPRTEPEHTTQRQHATQRQRIPKTKRVRMRWRESCIVIYRAFVSALSRFDEP
jgi:hypothetical protein